MILYRPWDECTRRWRKAEALHKKGRYVVHKSRKVPDFTLLAPGRKWLIWEHLGVLNNPAYKAAWKEKAKLYADNALEVGESLFVTSNQGDIEKTIELIRSKHWPTKIKSKGARSVLVSQGSRSYDQRRAVRKEGVEERAKRERSQQSSDVVEWKVLWHMVTGAPTLTVNEGRRHI